MATAKKYATMKGDFFIKQKGSSENFWSAGNAQAAELGMTLEKTTLESSGNESGTLASEETSRTATFTLTLNALGTKQMKMYFYSKASAVQAAATAQAFTLPALAEGEAFLLDHANVSNVEIETLAEGADYKVLTGGVLVALKAIVAGKTGTFDAGTADQVGMFTGDGIEYEVVYVSEKTGIRAHILRWKPDPAQALSLIGDEFASFVLEGECLIDESIAEGPLGRFAVVTRATAA